MRLSLPDSELQSRAHRLIDYAIELAAVFLRGFQRSSESAIAAFGFALKPEEQPVSPETTETVNPMFTDWKLDTRTPHERCTTKWLGYFLWGVGAYLNKQKVLRPSSASKLLTYLMTQMRLMDSDNFDSEFDYIRRNESDKFRQAGLLASGMLFALGLRERIHYLDDQHKLELHLIPLLELFLGYVSYGTETMFRPMEGGSHQLQLIEEYEAEVSGQYSLDFNRLHAIRP